MIRSFSVIAVRHARSHGDHGLDWLIERVLTLGEMNGHFRVDAM
jgi:hypothetical protein